MWQESDDSVGDLLKSRLFDDAGRMADLVEISDWWAKNGITIASDGLNRDSLFAHAERCREDRDADWVTFLWHVLAWGVMGDYRNAPRIVASATDADQRNRLNDTLRSVAESS